MVLSKIPYVNFPVSINRPLIYLLSKTVKTGNHVRMNEDDFLSTDDLQSHTLPDLTDFDFGFLGSDLLTQNTPTFTPVDFGTTTTEIFDPDTFLPLQEQRMFIAENLDNLSSDNRRKAVFDLVSQHPVGLLEGNQQTSNRFDISTEVEENFSFDLSVLDQRTCSELFEFVQTNINRQIEEYSTIEQTQEIQLKRPAPDSTPEQGPPNKKIKSERFSIKVQIIRVEKSDDGSYVCDVCEKVFKDRSNLVKHIRTHTREKPFTCPECDKSFAHSQTLKEHLNTHGNKKPYSCEHCNKSFANDANLKRHVRTHTNTKPYKCDLCGAAFSQSNNYKSHMTSIHEISDITFKK
ncbi:zinc finger protein [Acrasis kona]|uniref:Zinc finger protein n=1 Tax=Acrasis kona TaxID=1008807 RepID=A0AAW2YWL5_9EUKA